MNLLDRLAPPRLNALGYGATVTMGLPVVLGPTLSARLREALCAAATSDGEAGAGALQAALDDPAVHTVVIALQLRGEPGASLVQAIRASDALAQWLDISCI